MQVHPQARLVALCIRKPSLRERLIKTPQRTLTQLGVKVPDGRTVHVVADTLDKVHVVVPMEPGFRGPESGVVGKILERLRADANLRKRFLANPKQLFEELTGYKVPAHPELVAVLETKKDLYIHLPPAELGEVDSPAAAAAMWGGGGGDDTWTVPDGTDWGSGQVCNCQSDTYELDSMITSCCDTEWPDGTPIDLDGTP